MIGRSMIGWRLGVGALLAAACIGCSSKENSAYVQSMESPQESAAGVASSSASSTRILTRTASIEVEALNIRAQADQAARIVTAAGGYVHDSSVEADSALLRLQVPAANLDSVLAQLGGLGEEKSREISTEDVTDKLTDLEAEIVNKEASRDRLRALLSRSADVKDVLAVESELTRVQTELDSLKARRKSITDDVAFSSIRLRLTAPEPEKPTEILGPLGYLFVATKWFVTKLFVIRSGE